MRNRLTIIGASLAMLGSAQAQPAGPPNRTTIAPLPPPPVPARRKEAAAPVPSGRVLGVPVTADAPVSPAYDGTAYKTLGGQAETGQDAISGQVMQPTDAGRPHP